MTDAIPAVVLPKHILDRPGGAGVNPVESGAPWKQLAKLATIAPQLEGTEACCGHCTHLLFAGDPALVPAPSTLHPGLMHLSTRYGCALREGVVLADNVCQQFDPRATPARGAGPIHPEDVSMMRAKMVVQKAERFGGDYEELELSCVTEQPFGPEGESDDNTFARWSPSGGARLTITNPNLVGKLQVGQKFYVDFTPAQ